MHVEVNGARLYFDVDGEKLSPDGPRMREKPTLLLLHGGPGMDHSLYKPAFSQLADIAQVVYLDHRGNGRSEVCGPDTWTLDQWADDVREFCEVLGIEKPIVFGHSFGGMVAIAYAVRHPEHPARLIFSGTYARQNLDRVLDRFEARGGVEARNAAERFWIEPSPETMPDYARHCLPLYGLNPGRIEVLQRMIHTPETGNHFIGGEARHFDLLGRLSVVQCPTLVLGGALDPVCPIEEQEEIVRALPSELTHFERFEECSHMFWGDVPDRFFSALREFVREGATA